MDRVAIANDLKGAWEMTCQAQERAPHLSELWHVLGKLADRLDEETAMLQDNEVNDEGNYI